MMVSAQIAIYPLRQERLAPAVHAVSDALTARGLAPSVGPMSTLVAGQLMSSRWAPGGVPGGRGGGSRRHDCHAVQRLPGRL
jgi:hypothetical protein